MHIYTTEGAASTRLNKAREAMSTDLEDSFTVQERYTFLDNAPKIYIIAMHDRKGRFYGYY